MSEVGPPLVEVLATWAATFALLVGALAVVAALLLRRVPELAWRRVARACVGAGALAFIASLVLLRVDLWGGQNEEVAFVLSAAALVVMGAGAWLWRRERASAPIAKAPAPGPDRHP